MFRNGYHGLRRLFRTFSSKPISANEHKSIRYTPYNMHTEEERIAGVLQDVHLFEYIPVEMRTEKIYLAATWHPIFSFHYFREEQINLDLCRYAIQFNARQYAFVPECYLAEIREWLSQVRTLVVRDARSDEIRQFTTSYVRAEERKGSAICVDSYAVKYILNLLQALGLSYLQVTFLDHSAPASQSIANHTPNQILSLLAQYPFIRDVELLGCHSVSAEKLKDEEVLISKFKSSGHSHKYHCGLVLMKEFPSASQYDLLLQKSKLDRLFLIEGQCNFVNGVKEILYLEKSNSGMIKHLLVPVTDYLVSYIEQQLRNGKPFVFPKRKDEKFILRDINNPLKGNALEVLMRARDEKNESFSSHCEGVLYPFDADVKMHPNEVDKLRPSFMYQLVHAIRTDSSIIQEVTIKGWPRALHCDIQNKKIVSANENVYYRRPFTLFENRIDLKSLARCRRRSEALLDGVQNTGMADVNSIAFTVKSRQ